MLLKEYLTINKESINAFAARAGISYQSVFRICNGTQINVTLKTLAAIEAATDGQVTREDFDKQLVSQSA